jgi:Zn-dependent protease
MSSHRHIDNMAFWFLDIAGWVTAALVSILVHELGHALVFRHVFVTPSNIIIHGFGGVTVPLYPHQRRYGIYGLMSEVFLSAAGPLAGFVLAGLAVFLLFSLLNVWGGTFFDHGLGIGALSVQAVLIDFLECVFNISIIWGIFNLLPIYPMDGGHISREIFSFIFPRNGVSNSLVLSIITAILLAVLAFRFGQPFITLLFAYFAYQNYQELSFRSFKRWSFQYQGYSPMYSV